MAKTPGWWMTDEYENDEFVIPWEFESLSGPKGVALVRAWPSGVTDQGWGLQGAQGADGFMPRYTRGEFDSKRIIYGYERSKWAFAFVMRSMQILCVDIDGKNGGFDHAKKLGRLPPTLAETSKSGNGYHLFYSVPEDWNPVSGYGELSDRIGLEQGVDIRATGCVYHHDTQRWNRRPMADAPPQLIDQLKHREQKLLATTARITSVLADADPLEVLLMHDEILNDLAKPMPQGKRNNTLFAIGQKMREAEIPDWEQKLSDRATQVGLDQMEIGKLIGNIEKYGGN